MSRIIVALIGFATIVAAWVWMYATDQQVSKVQALMIPAVALLAVCVALAQWNIARNKLKLDLFDRRFAVYRACTSVIQTLAYSHSLVDDDLKKFAEDTTGATFIFDDPAVGAYIAEIQHHASESVRLTHKLRSYREPKPEEQRPMAEERETHRTWCQNQLKTKRADWVFKKSLQLGV